MENCEKKILETRTTRTLDAEGEGADSQETAGHVDKCGATFFGQLKVRRLPAKSSLTSTVRFTLVALAVCAG